MTQNKEPCPTCGGGPDVEPEKALTGMGILFAITGAGIVAWDLASRLGDPSFATVLGGGLFFIGYLTINSAQRALAIRAITNTQDMFHLATEINAQTVAIQEQVQERLGIDDKQPRK